MLPFYIYILCPEGDTTTVIASISVCSFSDGMYKDPRGPALEVTFTCSPSTYTVGEIKPRSKLQELIRGPALEVMFTCSPSTYISCPEGDTTMVIASVSVCSSSDGMYEDPRGPALEVTFTCSPSTYTVGEIKPWVKLQELISPSIRPILSGISGNVSVISAPINNNQPMPPPPSIA